MPRERQSEHKWCGDPIVIDPPDFDLKAAWGECRDYSDRMNAAGRPVAALHGADPGVCSCPACHAMYWRWGSRQRCKECEFEYPTNAWSMYSYGVQAANPPEWMKNESWFQREHQARLSSPYYRYGFEHPVEHPFVKMDHIDWRAVVGQQENGDAP